jgi:hypothetical protein
MSNRECKANDPKNGMAKGVGANLEPQDGMTKERRADANLEPPAPSDQTGAQKAKHVVAPPAKQCGVDRSGAVVVVEVDGFDRRVKRLARRFVERALNYGSTNRACSLADELINGTRKEFWRKASRIFGSTKLLPDFWQLVCAESEGREPAPSVAACIVAGFMRVGFPLTGNCELTLRYSPPIRLLSAPPLCAAVFSGRGVLATALLDLPPDAGIDVNAAGVYNDLDAESATPLGHTNGNFDLAPEVFVRLLRRTDRSLVTSGGVYVHEGRNQHNKPNVHVLISSIFHCTYVGANCFPSGALKRARAFIAEAEQDGGGTDLTGGIGLSGPSRYCDTPLFRELWPDGEFTGALSLVDRLSKWWSNRESKWSSNPQTAESAEIVTKLETIKTDLVVAKLRIRTYHRDMPHQLTPIMSDAGIHIAQLHNLVSAYVFVPLHDPSMLAHPLLQALP